VANRLGELRNDFVHTAVDFDSGTASVVPDNFAATDARKKQLTRPNISDIALAVKDDAFRLACFVFRLEAKGCLFTPACARVREALGDLVAPISCQ
jgi:hypothetical protein